MYERHHNGASSIHLPKNKLNVIKALPEDLIFGAGSGLRVQSLWRPASCLSQIRFKTIVEECGAFTETVLRFGNVGV